MAASTAAELPSAAQIAARLQALLEHARAVKPGTGIDPPLAITELVPEVDSLYDDLDRSCDQLYKFALTDYAAREIFYSLIDSTDIDDPKFVEVWNLLDVLLLCSDREQCGGEVVEYLVEELLDSQTTDGCKRIFDYLESRRERLIAKDFHKKNLILLRACNELLRRLSRAEDAIFCGRVFFFLFQTFPLGDRSSVNLRGEFHVENTTRFEVPVPADQDGEKMDEDHEPAKTEDQTQTVEMGTPQPPTKPGGKALPKTIKKRARDEELLSNSELYPIFWRLQQDFSDPTRLFASEHFETFKKGLARTLTKFRKHPVVKQSKAAEDGKRGVKRKLGEDGSNAQATDHFVDDYNPKYLTSRDLFDLELSDLVFQRHIMAQALILIDFMLSLTEKVKAKARAHVVATAARLNLPVSKVENRSMVYSFTLSEEDTKWATTTRSAISVLLSAEKEDGRFYHRMVDTVLTRDKNWVQWKLENCQTVLEDPVPAEHELEARAGVRGSAKPRRVPEKPMGAMDLGFLEEGQGGGLEALKAPARFTDPTLDDLIDGVRTDKLDLEMAMDDEEKSGLENAMANKTWRALRQVRATDLNKLNDVDPAKDLEEVFRPQVVPAEAEPEQESTVEIGLTAEDGSGVKVEVDGLARAVTVTNGEANAGDGDGDMQPPVEDAEASGDGTTADT